MSAFAAAVDSWALVMLAVTWQLAALAALAWLCERLFRLRQARVRHALWWFVLVAPLALTPVRMALQSRQAVIAVPAPVLVTRVAPLAPPPRATLELVPLPAVPHRAPVVTLAQRIVHLRLAELLATAWLLGCAVLALRLLVGRRRVRLLLGESRLVSDGSARKVLSALCAQAGVRGEATLRASRGIGSPVLCGWRRPVIVMPAGWLDALTEDELRAMLAHEVAHVRRRDFPANTVQRLVGIPLFYHPGAWLASRRIVLAREELCDAWALALGIDAAGYARCLTAAAERAQAALGPVSLGIAESRFTLLRRVEAIMQSEKLRRLSRLWAGALVVALALAAGALVAVQVKAQSGKEAALPPEAEVPLTAAPSANLTPADTEAALQAAGVRMQRFDYDAPFPHSIVFTFGKYVGGRLVDEESQGGLSSTDVGKQSFLLTIRQRGTLSVSDKGEQDTRTMSFYLSNRYGSFGGAPVYSFKGYLGESYGALRSRLVPGKRVPVYAFVTNRAERRGIRGFSDFDTVAGIVSHYDMAIIVYAELRRTEEASSAVPAPTTLAVSAAEPIAPPAGPGAAAQAPALVYETITLKYWPAWYILYQFGLAAYPEIPEIPGLWPQPKPATGGPPARAGGGALISFLPEGIKLISAASSQSQQLLVAGTPEAVAQLREFIELLDKKPQRVILSIMVYEGAPENGVPAYASAVEGDMTVVSPRRGDAEFRFRGRALHAMRTATMNLLPVSSVAQTSTGSGQSRQSLIVVVPRINGDGSITVSLRYVGPSESDDPKVAIFEGRGIQCIVNIRDAETLGILISRGGSTNTLTITPRIVRE
jgi:beta-lactamase regulating signal transducer with metallopeptidase domain